MAKHRVERETVHQKNGDILYTRTAAKVNVHEGAEDFAVLINIQFASHAKD